MASRDRAVASADERIGDSHSPSLRSEWRPLLALAAWFVIAAAAVGAHRDVPVIDDWTYAWSVEQMLEDGRLAVLDWSAVYPIGHVLWGTAWSLIFGFSFVTLRLSTLALALVAAAVLHLTLRELGASRRVALLGALSVAVNPAMLLLSSSFMTDVPFIAFTLLALLCYVRAMRRQQASYLWWGAAWACAAFLDRQIGLLTPLAAVALLAHPGRAPGLKRSTILLSLAATAGAMLAGSFLMTMLLRPTGEMSKLVDRLVYVPQIPPATYLRYNLYVLPMLAFYALPALLAVAALAGWWRRRALFAVLAVVAAIMVAFTGEIPVPLRPGGTWTLSEVGGSRVLMAGSTQAAGGLTLQVILRALGLLASAILIMALVRPRDRSALSAAITPRTPLIVYLVAYLLIGNVLWMYNDRYLLVMVPVLVALALGRPLGDVRSPRLAWAVTVAFGIVAVAGTRDALSFNEHVRDSWQTLVDKGIRPSDIDAGYTWTGWTLYAHPENLPAGLTSRDVPWITSKRRLPYLLAKGPVAGYDVTGEVSWTDIAPWPGPDRLFVLKRHAPN